MDAPNDTRGQRAKRDRRTRCAACGGELNVLVEVPTRGQPYAQNYPSTQYFRCVRCNQIQIVDD